MDRPWLLFLHGINTGYEEPWREQLTAALTRFGGQAFPHGHILTPDYRAALRGEGLDAKEAPNTWKRPAKGQERQARTDYLARMARLESVLRPLANASPDGVRPPELASIPPGIRLVDDARRYARSREVKAAVQQIALRSLDALPEGSRVVLLAHSLGSVIAADLLKKLPAGIRVAALVTIGSPLGAIKEFQSQDLDDFPFDRVGAWVNVFEPRDLVTGGRGIGARFPWAIDLPVTLQDWLVPELIHQHGAEHYCTHGTVAKAIVEALRGSELVASGESSTVVEGLELLLLQALYLRELAKRLPADDFDRMVRLERARSWTAASHASASAVIHAQKPATAPLPASEFLERPHAHIHGVWDDRTVLALAIMMASGPPAHPFRIEEKWDTRERREALVSTLDLIRTNRFEPTDTDIVDAIFSARAEVSEYLASNRSWVPAALVAAGVVTLAATGIGLWLAAPAGLAGAALVTSTLAAFGPGGMVGGMAALATLAGASTAMAAAGVTMGATDGSRAPADLLTSALDEAIASGNVEALRSLLISLLTLVAAQERLHFPGQREQMLLACLNTQARLTEIVVAHGEIDPKSDATKTARKMLELLEKACAWLRGEVKPSSDTALAWNRTATAYREALGGRPNPLVELTQGTGSSPEPPALEGPVV